MKFVLLAPLLFLPTVLNAAEKRAAAPVTFYVSGLECGSCVYAVYQSISELKGVSEVNVVQSLDGHANVRFDPAVVSEHQIAQAVAEAYPLHGKPYLATLKACVPDYGKNGNAAKLAAVFNRWKGLVKVETTDQAKGEFTVHFLPLKTEATVGIPSGWSLARLISEITAPHPKGLGLALSLVSEID